MLRRFFLSCLLLAPTALLTLHAQPAVEKLFAARFVTGPMWAAGQPVSEQQFFREHSAHLAKLRHDGVIQFGARYGDTGLIVVRAADAGAARRLFADDPSLGAGTFALTVDPFSAFYAGSTNHLATPEAAVMRGYLDAFNRHDADAVADFCVENLQWFSIADGKVGTEAESREQLRTWLVGYFKSFPTVHSEFLSLDQSGPFLTVRERASWDNKDGKRVAQQSVAVYEVRDGRILRAWYFPAARDPLIAK